MAKTTAKQKAAQAKFKAKIKKAKGIQKKSNVSWNTAVKRAFK